MLALALDPLAAPDAPHCEPVQCLGIVVQPDPGALARVLEPFAKRGLVPLSVNSRLYAEAGQLIIDIQIAGMAEDEAGRIASQIASFPICLQVTRGAKYAPRRVPAPSAPAAR